MKFAVLEEEVANCLHMSIISVNLQFQIYGCVEIGLEMSIKSSEDGYRFTDLLLIDQSVNAQVHPVYSL